MLDQLEIYIALLGLVVFIGSIFSKSTVPTSLLLVISGMAISGFSNFPKVEINPNLVLDVFLPLLLYDISSSSSWKDVKKNMRPIALLSVGHVIFITIILSCVMHYLIPKLGWPLAFVLGAVLSPPDDVAIVSIAEKIRMPKRIVTILEGEGMLNDATALIIFRFALAGAITHQFSVLNLVSHFFIVIVVETFYGLALGYVIGALRCRIRDPLLHMIASILTPFLAYLPAERLGGCGVLATVVTGFVIGHVYSVRFSSEFRLLSRAVWPTLSFTIQSILFLLIGLDLKTILGSISSIPVLDLLLYGTSVVSVLIVGRFVWVYPASYLPRFWFASIRKTDPYPPWQFPFVISWCGMRGSISLAAALAVPNLPYVDGIGNPKSLLIFLVFCAIITTLIFQGLSLPWLLKVLKIPRHSQTETYSDHVEELSARLKMANAVLKWLKAYKKEVSDHDLLAEIKLRTSLYQSAKEQIENRIKNHDGANKLDDLAEVKEATFLALKLIEIERSELLNLYRTEKINHSVKNKIQNQLDHKSKYLA